MKKLLFILLSTLAINAKATPPEFNVDIDSGITPQVAYDELKTNGWAVSSWDLYSRSFSVSKSAGVNFTYQGATYNTNLVLDKLTYTATNYPSQSLISAARTALSNALNLQFSSYDVTNGYE